VRDFLGATAQSTVTITVSAASPALDCSASATPTTGSAPLSVAFTGDATGGTTPYTYRWQFGDGSTSTERSPNHTYQTGGSYTATFTVTDASAKTCSKTISITVSQPPAGPNLSGPSSVPEGQTFALTWSYTWPSLATTGEKVVLERSTTSSTSGFTIVAEIPRGGSTQFLVVNPPAGRYYFRARARVSLAGQLTWTAYSSVVTVNVESVVSRTRFNNPGTYFIVSLKVDGIEQFTSSPEGLPGGYYYEMELAPGSHSYEALFGYWNQSGQREYLYRASGTFVQRSGVTENVSLPGPTIRDLLTKFSNSGFWTAWIPGSFQKAGYRFYANGTYDFYVGDELRASGTYTFVSRNATTWAVTFSDGYFEGVLYETLGYFVMYNGPNGGALQYFHDGP
jgi:PKD repeat protein